MEKQFAHAVGEPVSDTPEQNGCPFSGGARKHALAGAQTNAAWWPNQLNLKILHQRSPASDPMGRGV